MLNFLKPEKSDSIAIWGLGAVGMSGLWAALVSGVETIIVVDLAESRLLLAKEFGATHALNGKDPDLLKKILEATNGLGVDKALEATGVHQVLKTAYQAVAPCGVGFSPVNISHRALTWSTKHLVSAGTPGPGFDPPFEYVMTAHQRPLVADSSLLAGFTTWLVS